MSNLSFLNEGHQPHIIWRNDTPDSIGEGCLDKLSTDFVSEALGFQEQANPHQHHQVLSGLWVPSSASMERGTTAFWFV